MELNEVAIMYKQTLFRCLRIFIVIGSIIFLYFTLKYMIVYFYPFLIALLFSFLLHPFVTYLERKLKFPRILATFFIVLIVFVLVSGLILFIITEIIQGTTYLAIQIPDHFQSFITQFELFLTNKLVPWYQTLTSFVKSLNMNQQSTINENIQQFMTQLTTSGTLFLKDFFLKIPAILSMIPYSITIAIFTIIATILIINDWFTFKNVLNKVIPQQLKNSSDNIVIYFKKSLLGYMKAQFILIAISAFITLIGLLFLNINHALTITLIIAIVDLLPLVGTGVVFIPWIGYLFLTAHYPLTMGLSIIYIVIIITRQIIEPKVISANIGISPLITLLAVFISIQLWGLLGVLITPLILVSVNTAYQAGIFKQIWYYVKG